MIVTSVQIKTAKTQKHLYCPVFTNKASGYAGGFIFLFRPYKFRLYHAVQIPLCISILII